MHVSSLTDGVVPSAGATPNPARVNAEHVSGMIEPASTVHVSPSGNCDEPSAGASPAPTDTVDMRVPRVFSSRCLCPAQFRFEALCMTQVLMHFRFKRSYVGRVLVSGHRRAIYISYDLLLREQLQLPLRVQLPLLRTRRCRSPEGGILSSIPPPTRRHHHSRTRAGLLTAAREKHRAATATSVSIANA